MTEPERFVRVGDAYYLEATFQAAFGTAALEAINGALARPRTERGVFRAVRQLRSVEAHRHVLENAFGRLAHEVEGNTRAQVQERGGVVVARFRLDKPSATP